MRIADIKVGMRLAIGFSIVLVFLDRWQLPPGRTGLWRALSAALDKCRRW
jgi:hypothetical protein